MESLCVDLGYQYKAQLLELERVSGGRRSGPLTGAEAVITPLVWQQWERELEDHPDKEWVQFLVRGIRQGFRVGHDQSVGELRRCRGNMCSAREQSAVIQEYLDKEVEAGRMHKIIL